MLLEDFINNLNEKYADAFGDYKFSITNDSRGYYLSDANTFVNVNGRDVFKNKIVCVSHNSLFFFVDYQLFNIFLMIL